MLEQVLCLGGVYYSSTVGSKCVIDTANRIYINPINVGRIFINNVGRLPLMIVLSIYSVGNTTILCGLGCLLTFDVLESRAGELEPGVAERLDIFPWPGDVVSAI